MAKDKAKYKALQRVERAQRRVKVAALYVKGYSQSRIAEELQVSSQTVNKDLNALLIEWKALALRDFEERKAEELAKLNHLESIAWEAWQRSIDNTSINKRKVDQAPERRTSEQQNGRRSRLPERLRTHRISEEITTHPEVGDNRFLDQVRSCIELRMKALGMFKQDVNNFNQLFIDWSGLYMGANSTVNVDSSTSSNSIPSLSSTPIDTIEQRIIDMEPVDELSTTPPPPLFDPLKNGIQSLVIKKQRELEGLPDLGDYEHEDTNASATVEPKPIKTKLFKPKPKRNVPNYKPSERKES